MNDRLVWIDCEMTGLDLTADALIEVAALVTDFDLNVLGDGVDLVIKPPAEALDQMDDFVRDDARDAPGLLDELDARHHPRRGRAAGARLHPGALRRRQPAAAGRQHGRHRPLVPRPRHAGRSRRSCTTGSSTSPRSRSWRGAGSPAPTSQAPTKRGNHRALADIQESIEELRYYRDGRLRAAARARQRRPRKALAAEHGGSLTGLAGERPVASTDAESPVHFSLGPGLTRGRMVGVAQLVERRVVVADVAGSSPVTHPTSLQVRDAFSGRAP